MYLLLTLSYKSIRISIVLDHVKFIGLFRFLYLVIDHSNIYNCSCRNSVFIKPTAYYLVFGVTVVNDYYLLVAWIVRSTAPHYTIRKSGKTIIIFCVVIFFFYAFIFHFFTIYTIAWNCCTAFLIFASRNTPDRVYTYVYIQWLIQICSVKVFTVKCSPLCDWFRTRVSTVLNRHNTVAEYHNVFRTCTSLLYIYCIMCTRSCFGNRVVRR